MLNFEIFCSYISSAFAFLHVCYICSLLATVAPKVRLTPAGPLRVRMGDPVSVECRATGRPRPKMTWKRQGSTLQLVTKEANGANVIQVKTHKHTGIRMEDRVPSLGRL